MLPHRLTPAVVSHAKGVYADVNWRLPSVAVTVVDCMRLHIWYFQSHPLPAKHVGTQRLFHLYPNQSLLFSLDVCDGHSGREMCRQPGNVGSLLLMMQRMVVKPIE